MNECWLFRRDRQGRGGPLDEEAVQIYRALLWNNSNMLVELVGQDQRKGQLVSKACLLWTI